MSGNKYLGQTYGDWTVVSRNKISGKYSVFTLQKKRLLGLFKKTMTMSDKTLRLVARGEKTVEDVIEGKRFRAKQFLSN